MKPFAACTHSKTIRPFLPQPGPKSQSKFPGIQSPACGKDLKHQRYKGSGTHNCCCCTCYSSLLFSMACLLTNIQSDTDIPASSTSSTLVSRSGNLRLNSIRVAIQINARPGHITFKPVLTFFGGARLACWDKCQTRRRWQVAAQLLCCKFRCVSGACVSYSERSLQVMRQCRILHIGDGTSKRTTKFDQHVNLAAVVSFDPFDFHMIFSFQLFS